MGRLSLICGKDVEAGDITDVALVAHVPPLEAAMVEHAAVAIELEEAEPVAAAPVRRARAGAAAEEETESGGLRVAMLVSAAIMFLTLPVTISISKGEATDLSKQIAGIFAKFDQGSGQ